MSEPTMLDSPTALWLLVVYGVGVWYLPRAWFIPVTLVATAIIFALLFLRTMRRP